jgi:hypothetical protein
MEKIITSEVNLITLLNNCILKENNINQELIKQEEENIILNNIINNLKLLNTEQEDEYSEL